jgi:hypothetical protein
MSELRRPWQQIDWKKSSHIAFTEALSWKPENSLREAIQIFGTPSVAGTAIEEAQVLLSAAAEVEHSLLVEYLYAAMSLGNSTAANRVRGIAIQEMCHFITVQNLLLFAGAQPLLQRQDQDPHPTTDPFPFSLRPLTQDVLEDFLLAEMPSFKEMNADQQNVMGPIIAARGSKVHPVGLIYAQLYWLFQKDDQPTAEWPEVADSGLTPGRHIDTLPADTAAATFQVDPVAERQWHGSFGHGGVFLTITSRESALSAIAAIARQGEGLSAPSGDLSHFEIFLDIFNTTDLTQLPIVRMPTDPFVASQSASDPAKEANRITQQSAAAVCAVFDTRYRILISAIRGALSRDRTTADATIRSKYADWAIQEMTTSVKGLSVAIPRIPCKDGGNVSQLAAGPTFALGGFSIPDDQSGIDKELEDLHRASEAAITAAFAANPDALSKINLQKIRDIDKGRFPNL